ncbi:hypothetical protein [Clostridium oceanicum]|uniref:Transposase n=1 Tax=Clostridium oceanicum TaxID=1543 RepID=A0ABP3UGC6_9CLOT
MECKEKYFDDKMNLTNKEIEESLKKAMEEGKKQGIKIGRKQSQIKIITNLLAMDMDLDIIYKITGLSLEEIKELIN